MNKIKQEIITKIISGLGATAFALSFIRFSGIKSILSLVILSMLAGTLGNLLFHWLTVFLLNQLQKANQRINTHGVYAFGSFPLESSLAPAAGGKGLSLAKLFQSGYPIPDGCILLPEAFIQDDLREEAWQAVREQLTRLRKGKTIPFAIRSSAAVEDSQKASFAGEFESVLDIRSDQEIREAIQTVLKSRHSQRVKSYSLAQGLQNDEYSITVVIQKMIQPDFAGVLFTVNPLTGNLSQMTGNYTSGLGEKLVSGEISASEFSIDRPQGSYHGPEEIAPIIKNLHRYAHAIENAAGCPQDIEWASKGKEVAILQARPITTLNNFDPIRGVWNDSHKGNFLWSATNLMEASPEVLTPFTASLHSYLDGHGGPSLSVKNYSLNGIIGGRFYANISVQVSAFARFFKGDAHRAYREISGWWGEIPEDLEIPLIPLTCSEWSQNVLPGLLRSSRMFAAYRKKEKRFLAGNAARCKELNNKIKNTTTKEGLLNLWNQEVFPLYRDSLIHVVAAASDQQVKLERDLLQYADPDVVNALLSNLSGLSGQFESMGPAIGLGMILNGKMTQEAYMEAYGHRGVNEGEAAWPRPAEDPKWLDSQLEEWEKNPVNLDVLRQQQKNAFDKAWQRFSSQNPRQASPFQKRIFQAAKAAYQREAVRSEATRGMTVLRTFALRAGSLLGIADEIFYLTIDEVLELLSGRENSNVMALIPIRKETFQQYCALPPYPALICGRFDPFTWGSDPNRRTDVYDAQTQRVAEIGNPDHSDTLHGFAGALGIVEGTVRKLNSFEESSQFQTGEILVTTMTNIGWTPLFPRAAAIVTDLGAPLSHAAIVARELGIPAVVGCKDATMRLETGDRVRVDGGKGCVQILTKKE